MKRLILHEHDIKVIFLTLLVVSIILLIVGYIIFNVAGYQYFAVHKVGSINLSQEYDTGSFCNLTKDDVLRYLESYNNDVQDAEKYQKLYQAVENQNENTIFVISHGAPILYFKYYNGDDLFCYTVYGYARPDRIYIYRVNSKIPQIG